MHKSELRNKSCWVLFDQEKTGSEVQAKALAESLNFGTMFYKPIGQCSFLLSMIPRLCWQFFVKKDLGILCDMPDRIPDVIISSGSRASAVAVCLKRHNNNIKLINILNPRLPKHYFDLIIVPRHDNLVGDNILEICGSLHNIKIGRQANESLKHLTKPVVAVMIGGSNDSMVLDLSHCEQLLNSLLALRRQHGVSIVVSFSRRTSVEFKSKFLLDGKEIIDHVYDGQGKNYYYDYLEIADYIMVTADSISMVSEACATGKPVFVLVFGKMSNKFKRFYNYLLKMGAVKFFTGQLSCWNLKQINDMPRVTKHIRDKIL